MAVDARRPQPGFSAFLCRISSRISPVTFGLPGWRDRHRQNRRKPARRQDTTVSGWTIMSISPARIYPPHRPKEPVHATEPGSRLLSFDDGELLPQSSGLQCEPVARLKNARIYVTTATTANPSLGYSSSSLRRPQQILPQSVDSATGSGSDDPQAAEPTSGAANDQNWTRKMRILD